MHTTQFSIREINSASGDEVQLVATRMRETLIEVLGKEKGESLYTMPWLLERVRWHLNPKTAAKIYLCVNAQEDILGHAIARKEYNESGEEYGYFSTVYVVPAYRSKGIATSLIETVENWFREQKMKKIIYNTAEDHAKILRLFQHHKFEITHQENNMVQLTKDLGDSL